MKATISFILLLLSLSIYANTSTLSDGTQTTLTQVELDELRVWAENAQKSLNLIKQRALAREDSDKKIELYRQSLQSLIVENDTLNYLNMRKFLNRARQLDLIVERYSRRSDDFRAALYTHLIEQAADQHQSDIQFIEQQHNENISYLRAVFRSYNHLKELIDTRSLRLRSEAKIELLKTYLGYLTVDLHNSSYKLSSAFEIEQLHILLEAGIMEEDLIILDQLVTTAFTNIENSIAQIKQAEEQREYQLRQAEREAQKLFNFQLGDKVNFSTKGLRLRAGSFYFNDDNVQGDVLGILPDTNELLILITSHAKYRNGEKVESVTETVRVSADIVSLMFRTIGEGEEEKNEPYCNRSDFCYGDTVFHKANNHRWVIMGIGQYGQLFISRYEGDSSIGYLVDTDDLIIGHTEWKAFLQGENRKTPTL